MSGLKDTFFGDQPAPFVYPSGAGHRGVDTSVGAAASVLTHIGPMQKRILDFIRSRGDHGATYSEIMAGCSLGAPSVCGRMVELVKAKLVKTSGTRPTPSNRPARVYVAVEVAK